MSENTFKMPEKWKDLTTRQKEVLEKHYQLNKIIPFFLPKIRLIYAKKYNIFTILLGIFLIIGFRILPTKINWLLGLIHIWIQIYITVNNKEICYNCRKEDMGKILLKNRNKWDDTLPDYDSWKIQNNKNKRRRYLGILLTIVWVIIALT